MPQRKGGVGMSGFLTSGPKLTLLNRPGTYEHALQVLVVAEVVALVVLRRSFRKAHGG